MKSSCSTNKKSRIEPQLTHRIESKLLITSISKQTGLAPSRVLTRLDYLKHEQQFQKEYNLKFLSDRKRHSSGKKLSATKRSQKDTKKERMTETVQPQRLFSDEDKFRNKYLNLHETHLKDKEKWISDAQKLLTIKEAMSDFLVSPNQNSAESLSLLLENEQTSKLIGNHLKCLQTAVQKDDILKEVMSILLVDDYSDIIQNLRAKVQRFRNLNQCTFKILELETTNKQIVNEFDQRLKKIKADLEEQFQHETERVKSDLELTKRSRAFAEEELAMQREHYQHLVDDLNKLLNYEEETSIKWRSGRSEVIQVYKLIRNLSHKLRDIEVEAEENMFRLLKSNEDMLKLQQLMTLLRNDMSQQLTEQEDLNQESQRQIQSLNGKISQLQQELQTQKQAVLRKNSEQDKLKLQFQDQYSIIGTALGLKEHHPAKILLKIQELHQQKTALSSSIQQLKQLIKSKDQTINQTINQTKLHKANLLGKTNRLQSQIKFLQQDKQRLHACAIQLNRLISEQYKSFIQWVESSQKQNSPPAETKFIKRKDTPIDQEMNTQEPFPIKEDENLLEEEYNSNEEVHFLEEEAEKEKETEGNNVNSILQILIEGDTEIPSVLYWHKIEANFLAIRRKIQRKAINLKLDLSAIDSKEPQQPSPISNSINFADNEFFKRMGSESDEAFDLRQCKEKETSRSERPIGNSQLMDLIKKENEQLKQKILVLSQQKAQLEERIDEKQLRVQELDIKLVSLENETSIKGLQHNFKKLLDYLLADNFDLFEQTCRILMKMLHFPTLDIQDYEQKINSKKKKKKNGLFSSLFKN